MAEKNKSQEFRLKNIDDTRNHFMEEINQNELMINKYKKICKILNCIEHLLILAPAVTGSVSVSGFSSSVGIPVGIASFAIIREKKKTQ